MPLPKEEYTINIEKKLEKAFKKEESSFAGFFIKNFRFTYLIIFAILALGFFALFTLPREANPEVEVPFAIVTTIIPGASPTDVEELVTNKIEEKVKNLDNLNNYTSSSGQGISTVFVEFEADADLDESFRKLREAADNAKPNLPQEAEDPAVAEISFTDIAIVTYSLVGNLSDVELKNYADILKNEFEGIKNVSRVEIIGGLEREFQIIVDQNKLANYNLSLTRVISAISLANLNLPAGEIEIDGYKYNVRVEGRFKNAEALNNIVVATYGSTPVYIRDLAQVIDAYKEKNTESRIGFRGELPRNTISLQVYKKTGGNILNIVDATNSAIDKAQAGGVLPPEIAIQKTNDNSVWIKEDLSRLGKSGIQTIILIVLILLVVLSFRGAFITGLSVPIAFLMAFIFLKITGQTLNSITLFSLVLSLGLMVDNSIVIIEGIEEYMSKHAKPVYQAAILSVWNFKWPIISGTMTTVAAFSPMLLVSGIIGEYLRSMPITIIATLISSLFVALIVIPTLVARFLKLNNGQTKNTRTARCKKRHHYINKIRQGLQSYYRRAMQNLLPSKKKRRWLIAAAWTLFFISLAIPFFGFMKIELFGKLDVDYFIINVKTPTGTVVEKTRQITEEVEALVRDLPETDNYLTNIGTSMSVGLNDGMGSNSGHLANITVNLVDKKTRDKKSYEIAESLRPRLEKIQGAEVTIAEINAGPPTGQPVEVRIYGNDFEKLEKIAKEIVDYFESVPGIVNVEDSVQEASGEFTFTINKQKADYYGLSVAGIASDLRTAIFGAKASDVTIEGEDIDITVKYNENKFSSADDLKNILLLAPGGQKIPLKQIAELKLEPSVLSIGHDNGRRIITVTAGAEEGLDLQKVFADFDNFQNGLSLPDNYNIEVGGELEDIQESFQEVFLSMILSIILISFILVLQFNSFRQPFIILFILPLAIIGVIFGLNILRIPFSFFVFIGLVALSGIVVNDAIVLIDRINKNIADGMDFIEGIIEGGMARMQPIFLTTLTTVAGIFPLIFADELWRGLAVTVIFGLIFSTVLTLAFVPIMYVGLCRKEKACTDIE